MNSGAFAAACAQVGIPEPVAVAIAAARRGIVTARVESADAIFCVQTAVATDDGVPADAASLLRAAAFLDAVPAYRERFAPVFVDSDGAPVLCTRWILGDPLDLATPGGFRAAACTLAVVHGAGFVHADVQPGHFRTGDGDGTLLDFGLAHRTSEPMTAYRGGMVHFNAPELAAAILLYGAGAASPATDVYALGASAYWAVTGAFPIRYHEDASYDAMLEAIATAAPDLAALGGHPLAAVIAACIAPLGQRPVDAAALLALLAPLDR